MKRIMFSLALIVSLMGGKPANSAYQWPYASHSSGYVGTNSMSVGTVLQKAVYGKPDLLVVAFNRLTGKSFEVVIASNSNLNLGLWWTEYLNDVPGVKRISHSKDLKTIDFVVGGSGPCFKYTAKLTGNVYVVPPSNTKTRFGTRVPCKQP